VNAIGTPEFIHDGKFASGPRQFKKKLSIPACPAFRVKPPCSIKYLATEKCGWLQKDDSAVDASPQRHPIRIQAP
jgi:hypothetical protein